MNTDLQHYLKSKDPKLCVLATADKAGMPMCAVMAYAVKDDGSIILSTHTNSRKWRNMAANPQVALVFGWELTGFNVQMHGEAMLIDKGDEFSESEQFFFAQNPHAKQFQTPDTAFVIVRPTWQRITDFDQKPPKITEQTVGGNI